MSTYWQINLAAISVPLLFSFHPRFPFFRHWPAFFKGCVLTAVPFLIWDIIFTQKGIWRFNEMHLGSIQLFGMPLEEYGFFLCIPYACVFTYFSIKALLPNLDILVKPLFLGLSLFLFAAACFHLDKLYTAITFFSMSVFAVLLVQYQSSRDLTYQLLTYLLTLLPFFLVNGLLTGSWITEEVVWYNNSENLGIRLGTIPIEDTMYGMLLILMNITWFEFFRRRSTLRNYGSSR